MKRVSKYCSILLLLILLTSCIIPRTATKDDEKTLKSILKDSDFLYRNYFDDASIEMDDKGDTYLYTLKLRADEEYEYNTLRIRISKDRRGPYNDGTYILDLSQRKGKLTIRGTFITREESNDFIDENIINKLTTSTDKIKTIKLNKNILKSNSVDIDVL